MNNYDDVIRKITAFLLARRRSGPRSAVMSRALALSLVLAATPAWAGPYDAPSPDEQRRALHCLSKMTGLHWDGRLPKLVISDRVTLAENKSQALSTGDTVRGAQFGAYRNSTITITVTWQWPMLAHELTHFLQDQNGLIPHPLSVDQRMKIETLAYDVQARFPKTCMSFWGYILETPQ